MRLDLAGRREFYQEHKRALLNTATGFVAGAIPAAFLAEALTDSSRIGAVVAAGALAVGTACLEGVMTTYTAEEQAAIFIDAFGEDPEAAQTGQIE